MAFTQRQIREAKKMYNAPRNRKTWSRCIGLACKKYPAKKASNVGAKKNKVVNKTTYKKTTVSKKTLSGDAHSQTKDFLVKIEQEKGRIKRLEADRRNAKTKSEKNAIGRELQKSKDYKSFLTRTKNAIKKFI